MNKNILIPLSVSIVMLMGCSKGGSGSEKNVISEKENLESDMKGIHMAVLTPVNKNIPSRINGSLTILKEKEDFVADVRLAGAPGSVIHSQNIHLGSRCPDERDDVNGDGYIDAQEGAKVYREVLIPLDDDLTSQWMGLGTFPVSDEFGYYFWSRTAPYEKLLKDLRDLDINPADDFAKMNTSKAFNLSGNVVVITGVPEAIPLPESVSDRGRLTKHLALPIACGVIRKLESTPGIIDTDHTGIPVPEGETVGGSSGVDDGADFTVNPGTTTGGNYGEDDEVEPTNNETEFGNTGGFGMISSDGRHIEL